MHRFFGLFLIVLTLLAGCGSGSNNDRTPASDTNADLSDLILSAGSLDQIFQANQLDYTATVGFLVASTTVTPTTDAANATVTVNGTAVTSGTASGLIALKVGLNTIKVIVTSGDGTGTKTYTIEVERQTSADFAQQAYLKASNAEAFDQFGVSVALEGDTLVVGAIGEANSTSAPTGDNNAPGAGAVYVFTRINGEWTQQAYLKASNIDTDDLFGYSVALSGDTLAVGAIGEGNSTSDLPGNNNAPDAGAAYVFIRTSGVWTQQAYLKASNVDTDDLFGYSVALSDTIAVGAIGEANSTSVLPGNNNAPDAGAVYVFQ
jgi:hypothetical protein